MPGVAGSSPASSTTELNLRSGRNGRVACPIPVSPVCREPIERGDDATPRHGAVLHVRCGSESAISEALDQGDRAASLGEDSRGTMVRLQRLLDEVRKSGQASS
jgi:hypothetical protein